MGINMELNACEKKVTFFLNEQNTVIYISIKIKKILAQRSVKAMYKIYDGVFSRKK